MTHIDLREGQQAHPRDRIVWSPVCRHLRCMSATGLELGYSGVLSAVGTQGTLHEDSGSHDLGVVAVRFLGQPHIHHIAPGSGDRQDLSP
ncbi:hypothetical protein [Streptomyces lydicus]|uniref:hypothetical protein n=1 Tax=Streptomyces lydicus TaxID=47763 RepID=UPI0036E84669